jgi:hypothetical protein
MFERWLRNGDLRKRGPSDLRYVKPPDDLIVMLSLLIMAECSAKACAVVSRNSNEAIGECASRLLDDPRRLVSPYTPLQCPHRFSLFSCCS